MKHVKQVIAVRKDLQMRKGKMIAQGAHASRSAAKKAKNHLRLRWEDTGQTKIVVGVESEQELTGIVREAIEDEIPAYLVVDVGHTELEPGTHTAFAIGPTEADIVDRYTGDLKLL
jgi:PTH2 family peptidyl-tRNA hydrolase